MRPDPGRILQFPALTRLCRSGTRICLRRANHEHCHRRNHGQQGGRERNLFPGRLNPGKAANRSGVGERGGLGRNLWRTLRNTRAGDQRSGFLMCVLMSIKCANEFRLVLSWPDQNPYRMRGALGFIKPFQLLPQAMHFHANERVALLAEIVGSPKDLGRNAEFLDLEGLSAESLFAEIPEEFGERPRFQEFARAENHFQFGPFLNQIDVDTRNHRKPYLKKPTASARLRRM